MDAFCVLPFTTECRRLPPEEFVRRGARRAVCTPPRSWSARTSASATGPPATSTLSRRSARRSGSRPKGSGSLRDDGATVWSSTYVRTCIDAGDVGRRPRRSAGRTGSTASSSAATGRGRELGFPTANVRTDRHVAIPADGVYAGWLRPCSHRERLPGGDLGRHQPDVRRAEQRRSRPTSSTATTGHLRRGARRRVRRAAARDGEVRLRRGARRADGPGRGTGPRAAALSL